MRLQYKSIRRSLMTYSGKIGTCKKNGGILLKQLGDFLFSPLGVVVC